MTVYMRVITSPVNARELFRLARRRAARYADTFGPIDDERGAVRRLGVSHLVIAEVSQFLRHVLWLGLRGCRARGS